MLWASKQVITQHSEIASPDRATGACKQCRPDGCDMLTWAINNLKAHRQAANRLDRYAEPS